MVMERWRSVYCAACCARDTNWFAIDWVDRSCAELEPEDCSLPPLPPRLKPSRLTPPPPEALELCDWLFSTCTRALESFEFCCWYRADKNWEKVVCTEYRSVSVVGLKERGGVVRE